MTEIQEFYFDDWCHSVHKQISAHSLTVYMLDQSLIAPASDHLASVIPEHYTNGAHIARILDRLGKHKAATFLKNKLPETLTIRSGDLGEILATEYVKNNLSHEVPIHRLRWKDHRNMAMRGDDIIAVEKKEAEERPRFLKGEAKSRSSLSSQTLSDARIGLDKDQGLPSSHTLFFISEKLLEEGQTELADLIDHAQLKVGINPQDVEHLIFTFSGNNPQNILSDSLVSYGGSISQIAIGFWTNAHSNFVDELYEKVDIDAIIS